MTIEFSNTKEPQTHSAIGVAIVIASCAFFFIPTTLIILGYYSSRPTGTLISPLPQGVISEQQPDQATVAAPIDVTPAATEVTTATDSNLTSKVVTIEPSTTETIVKDPAVTETTQIYFSPRDGDKSTYSLKSKALGEFTIATTTPSDTVRYVDYHLVNP